MTEKIIQKVSSNGRVVIPKDWRKKLAIDDTKKIHPHQIEDDLFEGVDPFTDKEIEEVKKSLFSKI